ncbi:MAG: SDR family oxidoreductase [Proteobacteria bacterium]|nr:SDR family oxidoreductase [Pseudomonadota bacterium]
MTVSTRRVALVTGGATGIGRACVERFLDDGLAVLYTDINYSDGDRTLGDLKGRGPLSFVAGNVRERAHNEAAVKAAVDQWGRVDIVVANAGLQAHGKLIDSSDDDLKAVLDVNLLGAARTCRAALPVMIEHGGGAIVAISSINAVLGFPDMAGYDAAKAGLIALMRHIAVEHGRSGVRANALCPGATVTDFHIRNAEARGMDATGLRASTRGYGLIGRAGEPREIANIVAFLASDQASFITGQAIVADGGYSVAAKRSSGGAD